MHSPTKHRVYEWLIIALGLVVCFGSAFYLNVSEIDGRFLLLSAVTIIVSTGIRLKIPWVKYPIPVSEAFIFLAVLMFSREAAVLLGATAGLCSVLRSSKQPRTILFNMATMAGSTFLAVSAVRLFGGTTVFTQGYSVNYFIALLMLASTQYVSTSAIGALSAALRTDQGIWRTWKESHLATATKYLAGAFAACIMYRLIDALGFYPVVAITPLFLFVYSTYTVYLKNLEASKLQAEKAERHVDALRESEERFRSAFHHAAGMGLVGPDGRWIQVNKSLCEMLGYSEAELLLGTFQRSTHPDDLNLILEQLLKLRDGTISSLQLEQRYFHKKGHLRWMLLSVTTVNDPQKQSANLIFQMQDISERKQAEKKLVHDAFHDALTGSAQSNVFHGSAQAVGATGQPHTGPSICGPIPGFRSFQGHQ